MKLAGWLINVTKTQLFTVQTASFKPFTVKEMKDQGTKNSTVSLPHADEILQLKRLDFHMK